MADFVDQFGGWTVLLGLAKEHKTKAALRAAIVASGIPLTEANPLSGYYRCAAVKDGPLLPVAIWRDENGKLNVLRGGEPTKMEYVWPSCVWTPISFDWYEAATERGEKWPDAAALTVAEPKSSEQRGLKANEHCCEECVMGSPVYVPCNKPATKVIGVRAGGEGPYRMCDACADHSVRNRGMVLVRTYERPEVRAQIGGNSPPVEDEAQTIRSQIEAAKGVAEKDYQDITTDDQASAAQSLRSRLLTLTGDADKKREVEKQPHFEKAKAVDAKWQPVVKLGRGAADWLRDKLSAYATKKADEEAEARRKQLAEDAKRAAEQPKPEGQGDGLPADTAEVITAAVPSRTTIKGATGRAATVKPVKKAIVVNYDAAYAHVKAFPEVKRVIEAVAQRLVDGGNEVPGVEVKEERRVA